MTNPITSQEEKDIFIVEKLGGCLHEEWDDDLDTEFETDNFPHINEPFCKKCGYKEIPYYTMNLTTSEGRDWLWGKMREDRKRWDKFTSWIMFHKFVKYDLAIVLIMFNDNKELFRDTVYEFLKGEE